MNLKEKIKALPCCPGVYLMKDSHGSVIYVGKSKNLKSRVGSYFQNSRSHSPKVVKMVKHLKDFDYILTDTEFEAFMLECRLIKEIKPLYNRLMKSPEAYSYIKIKTDGQYPDIEVSKKFCTDDGNLYFGPYTGKNTVQRAIEGIKECYKIMCTGNWHKAAPCLNYSLGSCIGMCFDAAAREQYSGVIDKTVKLLNGSDRSIIEELECSMNNAAMRLDFEKAARYRDYLSAVNSLVGKGKVIEYAEKSRNIAMLEHLDDGSFKFFLIKGNSVLFSEKYRVEDSEPEALKEDLKARIKGCFGAGAPGSGIRIGREEIDEAQIIYSYLKNKSNNCRHIIIYRKWLKPQYNVNIDKALDKLLPPGSARHTQG